MNGEDKLLYHTQKQIKTAMDCCQNRARLQAVGQRRQMQELSNTSVEVFKRLQEQQRETDSFEHSAQKNKIQKQVISPCPR